jgi:predicted dehydrogenase
MLTESPVIHPAESHPSVILHGIASRDLSTAQKHQRKYRFSKAYGSYQDLLDDPDIDIVYISTPNGLHYEWAAKALKAGKHVLCEKPFTANADEAKKLVELAREKGLIVEEAVSFSLFLGIGQGRVDRCSSIGSSTRLRMRGARSWIRENTGR